MNTEKMIPIDFCRNITPFVPGDVYYNNFVDAEFTMDQRDADIFNNADPRGEFNTYFIVSFADRPNTTGKQPVADDVIVDDNHNRTAKAGALLWYVSCGIQIKTWKPNHESMLAKFKEQGANTMYTFENTKKATHVIFYHRLCKVAFANKDSNEILHGDEEWRESTFMWENSGSAFIELSYPIGERKEDHTIDGILKKAQPQGAKAHAVALTIEALDDNPDEQVIEPESMIASSEFYQSNNPQVIEPYVADHLKGLINPVSEECQAGDVISVPYSELPPCNGEIPKPVFTQEMAKHRQAAPIGSSVQTSTGEGVVVAHGVSYGRSQIVVQTNETMLSLDDSQYYPIDSRTDEERAVDDLIEIMQSDEHSYSEIIGLIKAGKIHGVKWIIE